MQPAARVSPLPRTVSATIVGALLVCAAAAWLITIRQASVMGIGGMGMAMMSPGLFLITWLVMMVAMMFPSVAPITLAFASVTRSRGEAYLPTTAFVLGYLLVWIASGLIPLAVLQVVTQIQETSLSFVPKLIAAMAVLLILGGWMLATLAQFATRTIGNIPAYF